MSVITSHRLSYDGDIRELLGDILGENTAIRYDRDKKDYTIRTIPSNQRDMNFLKMNILMDIMIILSEEILMMKN